MQEIFLGSIRKISDEGTYKAGQIQTLLSDVNGAFFGTEVSASWSDSTEVFNPYDASEFEVMRFWPTPLSLPFEFQDSTKEYLYFNGFPATTHIASFES